MSTMESMTNQPKKSAGERGASGVFPRVTLDKAIELAEAVYHLGHGDAVPRATVFRHLDRSANSGPAKTLISSATKGYGVIHPSSANGPLKLTIAGQAIVTADNDDEKRNAIYAVLFRNEIYNAFIQRYADSPMPIEDVGVNYLIQTHKLSDSDARACFNILQENFAKFNLVSEQNSRTYVNSPAGTLSANNRTETIGTNGKELKPEPTMTPSSESPDVSPTVPASATHFNGRIQPQIAFNIQILLPDNATPEQYEAIFRNIAVHLLGRNEE